MDLVGTLASQLGLPEDQAGALAGGVLGMVQGALKDEGESAAAAKLESAVPELDSWKQQAEQVAGGGGGLLGGLTGGGGGGLFGSLAGAVGGEDAQQAAQLAALIAKLGLDADKAALVAPLALQFLEARLGDETLDKVMAVAPFLTGKGGGVAGALGGLFS